MTFQSSCLTSATVILLMLAAGPTLADSHEAAGDRERTAADASQDRWLYVGTYTGEQSKGIYRLRMNGRTGELTSEGLAAEVENPSFLAVHPNGRYLYAVNEVGYGGDGGFVTAFEIDRATGELQRLNRQTTGGAGPCHLVVDRSGRYVLAANYGGGSVCVMPIEEGGKLGEATDVEQHTGSSVNPRRQQGPHAHHITVDPANRHALAADLGLDKVLIYRFDASGGELEPNDTQPFAAVTPGAGPRHLVFHPSGSYVYVINEMNSTVTAFGYEKDEGVLSTLHTVSTLPEGYEGRNSTAEIQAHPSGRFVYGSNRGHDSIAVFAVDEVTGRLRPVQHQSTEGRTPRYFGLDPSGRFLLAANQNSDNIVVFEVDGDTGKLSSAGHEVEAPKPVSIVFGPPASKAVE